MTTNPFGPGNDPRDDDADAIADAMERRGFWWDESGNVWVGLDDEVVDDAEEYLR
jgi:hypothetical protein